MTIILPPPPATPDTPVTPVDPAPTPATPADPDTPPAPSAQDNIIASNELLLDFGMENDAIPGRSTRLSVCPMNTNRASTIRVEIANDTTNGARLEGADADGKLVVTTQATSIPECSNRAYFNITSGTQRGAFVVKATIDHADQDVTNGIARGFAQLAGVVTGDYGDFAWYTPALMSARPGDSIAITGVPLEDEAWDYAEDYITANFPNVERAEFAAKWGIKPFVALCPNMQVCDFSVQSPENSGITVERGTASWPVRVYNRGRSTPVNAEIPVPGIFIKVPAGTAPGDYPVNITIDRPYGYAAKLAVTPTIRVSR